MRSLCTGILLVCSFGADASAGQAAEHRPFIVLGFEEDDLRLILPLATYRSGGLDKLCWMAQTTVPASFTRIMSTG